MRTRRAARRAQGRQRGSSLIDALIALALLAFGMLGMTTMLTRLIAQGTDAQTRITAAQLGDELLNLALVDDVANAPCYTLPASGTCPKAAARALTTSWQTRALAALPSPTVTATLATNGRFDVVLTWQQKDGSNDTDKARSLRLTTDVR